MQKRMLENIFKGIIIFSVIFVVAIFGLFGAPAIAHGQGVISIDSTAANNGVAVDSPGNYYIGTYGLEVWIKNGSTCPTGINLSPVAGSGLQAYDALTASGSGFYKEETYIDQTMTPAGEFDAVASPNLPDINPVTNYPVSTTFCLALVVWNSSYTSATNAINNANSATRIGVIAFPQITYNANGFPPPPAPDLSDGWNSFGSDLVMMPAGPIHIFDESGHGSVSPSYVSGNSTTPLTFSPNSGYALSSIRETGSASSCFPGFDGINPYYPCNSVSSCSQYSSGYSLVIGSCIGGTVIVDFAPAPYAITATAFSNGSISPSGSTSVASGGSQTYTITPSSGYAIQKVLVDGVNQGAISSYTFTNVSATHTISAYFTAVFGGTGYISNAASFAWATNAGWINFAPADSNGNYVGAVVTDNAVTGYAWSQNFGWINLSPAHGGITNNNGTLTGYAWSPNAGWINFAGTIIDALSGQFTGTAITGNSTIGNIIFTGFTNCSTGCGVITSWSPVVAPQGGGVGYAAPAAPTSTLAPASGPVPPAGGFSISINNGAAKTNNPTVTVVFNVGPDTKQFEVSSDSGFAGASPETYAPSKTFTLSNGDGAKTIYAKFFNAAGISSPSVSATITLDTVPPALTLNQLKVSYSSDEDVILSGTVSEPSQISLTWDNLYASVSSDSNNNWVANIGKLAAGTNQITLTAEDEAGNAKTISANIIVVSPQTTVQPVSPAVQPTAAPSPTPTPTPAPAPTPTPTPSPAPAPSGTPAQGNSSTPSFAVPIINNIANKIGSFFGIAPAAPANPTEVIVIPTTPPPVMQGKWNLLPMKIPVP